VLYNLDNMRYPTNQQGLNSLVVKPNVAPIPQSYRDGGYLEKLPADPWGNPYQYQNPGRHSEVDVYSSGPDGQVGGGEDDKGVIGSWQ
jgi:general secretion pathway protein G